MPTTCPNNRSPPSSRPSPSRQHPRTSPMARRGWRGTPPADDAEARKRIIDATLKCVERRGPSATTVTDVADAVGITRRAAYRSFSSTEELFTAAAAVALDGWTKRIGELTAAMSDPTELLVEAVAHLI